MLVEKRLEGLHRLFALVGRGKHHRGAFAVQVDEHGDVIVAPLGCRLVESEGLQTLQVKPGKGLAHIVFDNPPKPLVGDLQDPGGGQNRHLAYQHQGRLLEQKREPAAGARPRNGHAFDPVLRTVGTRNFGRDHAVVLEEIQMALREFLEVMGLARPAAVRTGKQSAPLSLQNDLKNMRARARLQHLIHQTPRRRHPKAKRQYLRPIHRPVSPAIPC